MSRKVLKRDIIDGIRRDLKVEDDNLQESLVAQVKTFNLPTELLSNATKQNHVSLYQQYVKDFNNISARLDTVDRQLSNSTTSDYRTLKIDETYSMNAAYLHELYFSNISDLHSEIPMDSIAYMRISRDFGTFDAWQKDFIACCESSQCGWAITYYNTFTRQYMNCSIDLHSLNVPFGTYPIIVMDVWQHAYYRDYLKDVKTYVFGMMKQLNWKIIESRIKKADKIAQVLRG